MDIKGIAVWPIAMLGQLLIDQLVLERNDLCRSCLIA